MPRLSVYLVRASLIYLILGFTLGGLLLANKGVMISPLIWAMLRYGVIRHEEAHLAAKFGEAYREYCARVRRWI